MVAGWWLRWRQHNSRSSLLRKPFVVDEKEYQKYYIGHRKYNTRDNINGFCNSYRMGWFLFLYLNKTSLKNERKREREKEKSEINKRDRKERKKRSRNLVVSTFIIINSGVTVAVDVVAFIIIASSIKLITYDWSAIMENNINNKDSNMIEISFIYLITLIWINLWRNELFMK